MQHKHNYRYKLTLFSHYSSFVHPIIHVSLELAFHASVLSVGINSLTNLMYTGHNSHLKTHKSYHRSSLIHLQLNNTNHVMLEVVKEARNIAFLLHRKHSIYIQGHPALFNFKKSYHYSLLPKSCKITHSY